jgi:prepilin-type processing-associated H-X9-DG protein
MENNDTMPPNNDNAPNQTNWVRGWLDCWMSTPDNTNTLFLTGSMLAPQLANSVRVWRCPADLSMSKHGGRNVPLVRSMSMNCWLNSVEPVDKFQNLPLLYKINRKTTDMVVPGPSQTFLTLDERADSINDGFFVVFMAATGAQARIGNFPASYHLGAGNLSFADGHSETHKWRDARTLPKTQRNVYPWNVPSPNNPDLTWLQERTTGLR